MIYSLLAALQADRTANNNWEESYIFALFEIDPYEQGQIRYKCSTSYFLVIDVCGVLYLLLTLFLFYIFNFFPVDFQLSCITNTDQFTIYYFLVYLRGVFMFLDGLAVFVAVFVRIENNGKEIWFWSKNPYKIPT